MPKKAKPSKKPAQQPLTFAPPPLTDEERSLHDGTGDALSADQINPGDEVNVVVRARVAEKGGEMVLLEMAELYEQNRITNPLFIPMPVREIRSKPLQPPLGTADKPGN